MNETDAVLPDTVRLVKDTETELNYTFNVTLRNGDIISATEGQYMHASCKTYSTVLQLAHKTSLLYHYQG